MSWGAWCFIPSADRALLLRSWIYRLDPGPVRELCLKSAAQLVKARDEELKFASDCVVHCPRATATALKHICACVKASWCDQPGCAYRLVSGLLANSPGCADSAVADVCSNPVLGPALGFNMVGLLLWPS
jgi:hypothetical protein